MIYNLMHKIRDKEDIPVTFRKPQAKEKQPKDLSTSLKNRG